MGDRGAVMAKRDEEARVTDVFNNDFIESYIELKMADVYRLEMTPNPVEFEMYYLC
jgi:glutamine synthetase